MKQDLNGQIALVTGGTDGIGKETALRLSRLGAEVILVGRNATKGKAVIEEISKAVPGSKVSFLQADLSQMKEVQRLSDSLHQQHSQLDILVHCAGVMLRKRTLTPEGLETVFAVQYLARFLLTQSMLDMLKASPSGRVVDVSAGGTINIPFDFDNLQGEKHYDGVNALQHESVANDMLMLEFQERHSQVHFYNYGPGFVRTTLLRDMPLGLRLFSNSFGRLISTSPQQSADDILNLLTSDLDSGLYTRKSKHKVPSAFKADSANRERLWQISEKLIAEVLKI